jgi:hypothetical protein
MEAVAVDDSHLTNKNINIIQVHIVWMSILMDNISLNEIPRQHIEGMNFGFMHIIVQ